MRALDFAAFAPLLVASCAGEDFAYEHLTLDSGADVSTDAGVGEDVVDASEISVSDSWPTVEGSVDQDAAAEADVSESGPVTPPPAPVAKFYSEAACPFPASISYEASSNTLLMACGAYGSQPNGLFRSPPLGLPGPFTLSIATTGLPSNHLHLNSSYYAVMHTAPDGFTIVDAANGQVTDSVDFATISPLDALYMQIRSTLNNPAGAVFAGGRIYMATSNLYEISATPADTTFYPGAVVSIPYGSDGHVSWVYAKAMLTSGINPTGMALIDPAPVPNPEGGTMQRIAVLSSNSYADNPADDAKLDVIDTVSGSMSTIPLGKVTAQVAPTLALTEDGALLFVGVQKPTSQLLGVNWSDGTFAFPAPPFATSGLVYGATAFGALALITDAGVFGAPAKNGAILIRNTDPAGWQETLVVPMPGFVGAGVVVNEKYYSTVTVPEGADAGGGMKGEVEVTELGGLQ